MNQMAGSRCAARSQCAQWGRSISRNMPTSTTRTSPFSIDQQLGAVVFGSTPMTRPPSSTRASASTFTRAILLSSGPS